MRFSYKQLNEILEDFPNFELSYEKKLHKKVQSDIYLTIPKGKKYFAWFKLYKNTPICFFLEINRRKKSIENIEHFQFPFNKILCAGQEFENFIELRFVLVALVLDLSIAKYESRREQVHFLLHAPR